MVDRKTQMYKNEISDYKRQNEFLKKQVEDLKRL